MKHHEFIVALRRKGLRPECVWLDVGCEPAHCDAIRELNRLPGACHIAIEAGDPIERLDLRSLTGCAVYVHGIDDTDVYRAFRAAQEAGASRVIGYTTAAVLDSTGRIIDSEIPCHG